MNKKSPGHNAANIKRGIEALKKMPESRDRYIAPGGVAALRPGTWANAVVGKFYRPVNNRSHCASMQT
jgi:hypothetical protein